MSGYIKIKTLNTINESSSTSDSVSLTRTTKHKIDDEQSLENNSTEKVFDFGAPKFDRNSSVSCSKSRHVSSSVKKAFSMRRSSSVSERYCRIHDQHVTLADERFEFGRNNTNTNNTNNTNKRGGIFKLCKRVFGI
ncbi:hypothetical protein ABFS82_02G074500 [Erythranthe guttata]|uniref:Uncharacterized protein n=1 Tax=Erythranthe guttata TaxID=4155 RepID=A0A022QEW4_ERYGU|nr:hypothetical protein MIMGU_mgv1a023299mg [Erythranthe guttata]